jgi:hypothetical protein
MHRLDYSPAKADSSSSIYVQDRGGSERAAVRLVLCVNTSPWRSMHPSNRERKGRQGSQVRSSCLPNIPPVGEEFSSPSS